MQELIKTFFKAFALKHLQIAIPNPIYLYSEFLYSGEKVPRVRLARVENMAATPLLLLCVHLGWEKGVMS